MVAEYFKVRHGLRFANDSTVHLAVDSNSFSYAGNTLVLTTNNVKVGIGNSSPTVSLHIGGTDAVILPSGNTNQRPAGANAMLRYNSELFRFEGYANGAWGSIGGGGGYYKGNSGTIGNAENASNLYRINANTHSANVTINGSENASVAGPITIADGYSLTINTGGRVVIV